MFFIVANKNLGYIKGLTVSLQKASQIYLSCLLCVKKALVEVHESMWFDGTVTLGRKANACEPELPTDKLGGTTLQEILLRFYV